MIGSSRSYAIGMAHYQLAGGTKSLVTASAAYAAIVGTLMGYYAYLKSTGSATSSMDQMVMVLLIAVEILVLVIFGAFRISGAVRGDISTRMIESHRLMPVPAWRAIAGYMLGSTTHAVAVAVINMLMTFAVVRGVSVRFEDIVITQVTVAMFAVFVWSVAIVVTLMVQAGQSIGLAVVSLAVMIFGSWLGFALLPGFVLVMTPMLGDTVFNPGAHSTSTLSVLWVGMCMQLAYFALNFAGACRRYRGTYTTTFNVSQALGMLGLWGAASLLGFWYGPSMGTFNAMNPRFSPNMWIGHLVASVTVAMLISLLPILTIQTRRRLEDESIWTVVLGMALVVVGIALPALHPAGHEAEVYDPSGGWGAGGMKIVAAAPYPMSALVGTILIGLAFAVLSYSALVIIPRKKNSRAGVLLFVGLLVVLMILPLGLEMGKAMLSHGPDNFGTFGNFSPIGAMVSLWLGEAWRGWRGGSHAPEVISPIVGIAAQCLIAGIFAMMALKRGLKSDAVPAVTTRA